MSTRPTFSRYYVPSNQRMRFYRKLVLLFCFQQVLYKGVRGGWNGYFRGCLGGRAKKNFHARYRSPWPPLQYTLNFYPGCCHNTVPLSHQENWLWVTSSVRRPKVAGASPLNPPQAFALGFMFFNSSGRMSSYPVVVHDFTLLKTMPSSNTLNGSKTLFTSPAIFWWQNCRHPFLRQRSYTMTPGTLATRIK